jgi:hypothetical protein
MRGAVIAHCSLLCVLLFTAIALHFAVYCSAFYRHCSAFYRHYGHSSVIANIFSRHCERSEAIYAQAMQSGRLPGRRLCLDCFVPRNDDVPLSAR